MYDRCLFCEEYKELKIFITGQKLCKTCMELRKQIHKQQKENFYKNLERAKKTVKSWPKWKQECF